MSGTDIQAYYRSPGVRLNVPVPGGPQSATDGLLDQRDADHLRVYGHRPGAPECTLPDRARYEQALRAQLTEQRCVSPEGIQTRDAQDIIRGLWPEAYIPDPGGDPDVNAARRDLAARAAALGVTRG